jgi:phosphoglycolate phosphatase-like HAD superfamily hydrolase
MKLILFDIDGTLVTTGGAGMRAMNRAFAAMCGIDDALDGIPLAGRTDRVIVRDALARVFPGEIADGWLDEFRNTYCGLLDEELAVGTRPGKRVLPGVESLLESLVTRADVRLALLTGNFARAARIKLGHFGLWDFFSCGAFGDTHVDRNALLDVALEAVQAREAISVPHARVYVVGDTPHDVACARAGGARAIAVATGIVSAEELQKSGADVVLPDLSNTRDVLCTLGCD